MKDTILYRRFVLVACFIAAIGMLLAGLIQQTRPTQRAFAPSVERFQTCGDRVCAVRHKGATTRWG